MARKHGGNWAGLRDGVAAAVGPEGGSAEGEEEESRGSRGSKAVCLETTWVREYKMCWRKAGGQPCWAGMAGSMKEMGRDKTRAIRLREDFEKQEIVGESITGSYRAGCYSCCKLRLLWQRGTGRIQREKIMNDRHKGRAYCEGPNQMPEQRAQRSAEM